MAQVFLLLWLFRLERKANSTQCPMSYIFTLRKDANPGLLCECIRNLQQLCGNLELRFQFPFQGRGIMACCLQQKKKHCSRTKGGYMNNFSYLAQQQLPEFSENLPQDIFFSLQTFVWKSSRKQMYPVFSSKMKNFLRILLISPLAPSSIIVIFSKPPKSLIQANVLQIINIWLHASNARSPENFSDGFKQTPVLSQLNTNEEYQILGVI